MDASSIHARAMSNYKTFTSKSEGQLLHVLKTSFNLFLFVAFCATTLAFNCLPAYFSFFNVCVFSAISSLYLTQESEEKSEDSATDSYSEPAPAACESFSSSSSESELCSCFFVWLSFASSANFFAFPIAPFAFCLAFSCFFDLAMSNRSDYVMMLRGVCAGHAFFFFSIFRADAGILPDKGV